MQEALAKHMLRKFKMGAADCVRSALLVSDELTGFDKASRVAGLYDTDAKANSMLANFGGLDSAAMAMHAELGFVMLSDAMYQEGDVAVIGGKTLGVWIGDGWACKSPGGFRIAGDAASIYYRPV